MADSKPGSEFSSWMSVQPSEVGQAVKSGLMAYGMQKSGMTDWLNNLNKKPDQPVGPVAPNQAVQPIVPPGAMSPVGAVAPMAPQEMNQAPQPPAQPSPKEIGLDWLNGKLSSFVNPQASRDISVAQQTNPVESPMNPAEWQSSSTGEGKLGQVLKAFAAMG